jgi:hypothetical protein
MRTANLTGTIMVERLMLKIHKHLKKTQFNLKIVAKKHMKPECPNEGDGYGQSDDGQGWDDGD